MEPANYADIIFFALLAGFIILKLRATLGRKDGNDNGGSSIGGSVNRQIESKSEEKIVTFPGNTKFQHKQEAKPVILEAEHEIEIKDADTLKGINLIKARDKNFTLKQFVVGAEIAFEIVLSAFGRGDKRPLQRLLTDDVYKTFASELDRREETPEIEETTLISILSSNVKSAFLKRNKARIEVEFISEQIHVTRGTDGEIIEGNPSQIIEIKDNWIFERDMKFSNPNWIIVAT